MVAFLLRVWARDRRQPHSETNKARLHFLAALRSHGAFSDAFSDTLQTRATAQQNMNVLDPPGRVALCCAAVGWCLFRHLFPTDTSEPTAQENRA